MTQRCNGHYTFITTHPETCMDSISKLPDSGLWIGLIGDEAYLSWDKIEWWHAEDRPSEKKIINVKISPGIKAMQQCNAYKREQEKAMMERMIEDDEVDRIYRKAEARQEREVREFIAKYGYSPLKGQKGVHTKTTFCAPKAEAITALVISISVTIVSIFYIVNM